jgi:hypothetical protein
VEPENGPHADRVQFAARGSFRECGRFLPAGRASSQPWVSPKVWGRRRLVVRNRSWASHGRVQTSCCIRYLWGCPDGQLGFTSRRCLPTGGVDPLPNGCSTGGGVRRRVGSQPPSPACEIRCPNRTGLASSPWCANGIMGGDRVPGSGTADQRPHHDVARNVPAVCPRTL